MSAAKVDTVVKKLCDWLKENDFDINSKSSLKLIQSENIFEGRCVLSKKIFEPNTTILEFPLKFLINYRNAFKNKDLIEFFEWHSSSNTELYKLTRLDALYLCLIDQKHNPDSKLLNFINSMPVSYDTPEYFDQSLIALLPNCLRIDIQNRLEKFEKKFKSIQSLLNEFYNFSQNNKSIELLVKNFDRESFKWAFCSVNSRCFHIKETHICDKDEIQLGNKYFGKLLKENELNKANDNDDLDLNDFEHNFETSEEVRNNLCCLIPYLDFLNHSFDSNAYAFFDTASKSYILKSQEIDFDEENKKKFIKENDQVYITYGHHDNKTLLIEYGFIIENNIYDKIVFSPKDFSNFIHLNKDENDLLWKQVIKQKLLSDLSCNKGEGPSWNLLKLLDLIYELNEENKCNMNSKKNKKFKLDGIQDFYEIKNQEKVRILYLELLNEFKINLNETLINLNKQEELKDNYHFKMIVKFCNLYLDIIEFNLNLANDDDQWTILF